LFKDDCSLNTQTIHTKQTQIPLGRMASADEIGKFAAFLASPMASYMSGGNYVLDGAMTSKMS